MLEGKRLTTVGRFWKYVNPEPNTGCWLWSGPLTTGGYGTLRMGKDWAVEADHRRFKAAHRISYQISVGEIPDGLFLDHICRVRSCVNPAHLRPVTAQQNIEYAGPYISAAHRNRKKTHCAQGHAYDLENTILVERGWLGWRLCRKCRQARSKRKAAQRLQARKELKRSDSDPRVTSAFGYFVASVSHAQQHRRNTCASLSTT